ncbi:MAG: glycosyltransferase [Patescibacteria group bacterium]
MKNKYKQESKVSCIIPFWNEDQRLFAVLDEVVKIKKLSEIICVDDASDRDRSDEIKKAYPIIKVIRLNKNVGKSDAILEGLKHAKGNFILLLDADLRNLNYIEINNAIKAIEETPDIDMLILRRVKAPLFVKITRGDVLSTGERIVKKEYLQELLEGYIKGWELESKINLYMYDHKKKVLWVPHSGINTHWKWGWNADLKYHKKKMSDIYSIGLINLIRLFIFFGKKKYLRRK